MKASRKRSQHPTAFKYAAFNSVRPGCAARVAKSLSSQNAAQFDRLAELMRMAMDVDSTWVQCHQPAGINKRSPAFTSHTIALAMTARGNTAGSKPGTGCTGLKLRPGPVRPEMYDVAPAAVIRSTLL